MSLSALKNLIYAAFLESSGLAEGTDGADKIRDLADALAEAIAQHVTDEIDDAE